jgi:hypothetical protein
MIRLGKIRIIINYILGLLAVLHLVAQLQRKMAPNIKVNAPEVNQ